MNGMKSSIVIVALLNSILFSGCEKSTKKLTGGYILERFSENGKYYVIAPDNKSSGGGVFDGTVEKIGWNEDWILAWVNRLYQGDTNGWYALNLQTKQVIGSFQESELKANPSFSRIDCYNCADVISGKKRK